MTRNKLSILILSTLLFTISCKQTAQNNENEVDNTSITKEQEEKAILETLNNETKAAFQRNYDSWKEEWIQEPRVTKTYIDFVDNTFSESVGWNEISQFVKTFIEEHPEPEPIPKLIDKIDVQLYGSGAWVVYEQQDSIRGLKRETRLMEKADGEWKIAGMQTTIYGFNKEE